MPIRPFLDLTTAHLSDADRTRLDEAPPEWVIMTPHQYGWWVWVPDEDLDERLEYVSKEDRLPTLEAILRHAMDIGADYINLDADGTEEPGLPVYEDGEERPTTTTEPFRSQLAALTADGREALDGDSNDAAREALVDLVELLEEMLAVAEEGVIVLANPEYRTLIEAAVEDAQAFRRNDPHLPMLAAEGYADLRRKLKEYR